MLQKHNNVRKFTCDLNTSGFLNTSRRERMWYVLLWSVKNNAQRTDVWDVMGISMHYAFYDEPLLGHKSKCLPKIQSRSRNKSDVMESETKMEDIVNFIEEWVLNFLCHREFL